MKKIEELKEEDLRSEKYKIQKTEREEKVKTNINLI
jgi:hypothetical protein